MPIQLPEKLGTYYFQIDVVEEGMRWFLGSGLLEAEPKKVAIEESGAFIPSGVCKQRLGRNDRLALTAQVLIVRQNTQRQLRGSL